MQDFITAMYSLESQGLPGSSHLKCKICTRIIIRWEGPEDNWYQPSALHELMHHIAFNCYGRYGDTGPPEATKAFAVGWMVSHMHWACSGLTRHYYRHQNLHFAWPVNVSQMPCWSPMSPWPSAEQIWEALLRLDEPYKLRIHLLKGTSVLPLASGMYRHSIYCWADMQLHWARPLWSASLGNISHLAPALCHGNKW